MPISAIDIYRSSNGDRWQMLRDTETGNVTVRHTPNRASGGKATEMSVDEFLSIDGPGPEYAALRRLLNQKADGPPSG